MILKEIGYHKVAAFDVTTVDIYTHLGVLTLNRSEVQALADLFADEPVVASGKVQVVEAPQPQPVIEATVSQDEEPKKRRGRPRKVDVAVEQQKALEKMPRKVEPDAIVALDGNALAVEVVAVDDEQVVAAHSNKEGTAGGVLIADADRLHEFGPYSPELQGTLVLRFPLGHAVVIEENGAHLRGTVAKHFDASHKVQVDVKGGARIVDMRELGDAPAWSTDEEVVSKMKGGTYGEDFGFRWLGAVTLPLEKVSEASLALGVEADDVKMLLAPLVKPSGLINTQAAAISLALHFGTRKTQPVDAPLTAEEVATIRAEVKAAGVTPAQAKDLCQRHFNKDSAALLTRSEMEKFLGEVLPTWVEMQGAEDF